MARVTLARQPRRLAGAIPQQQHEQRNVEHGIDGEGRDRAGGGDDDAADRGAEAARDVVADAVERDRRRQRFRRHLLADRGLPGRSEQRDAAADNEAEYQQADGRGQAERVPQGERGGALSAIDSEIIATTRRWCMSAIAPAGIAIRITGSISAVCTSATLSADEPCCVIARSARRCPD